MKGTGSCQVCGGVVTKFLDLGTQPLSDAFVHPENLGDEFTHHLLVGCCVDCAMVQLLQAVPRELMFGEEYPYYSSGSRIMQAHFSSTADALLDGIASDDPFVVEIGSNDGVMLECVARRGVRHLGVEPSGGVARVAEAKGVDVRVDYFDIDTATSIRDEHGPADVIFSANTLCHIPYITSVLDGVRALLTPDGVFVFEDPYFLDITEKSSFDQIYDEHFFLFSATSVQSMAARNGLELVDVERLQVHGGEMRYTLARPGSRTVAGAVAAAIAEEAAAGLTSPGRLVEFGESVRRIGNELRSVLEELRDRGCSVAGYGATAKSSTIINFAGIDSSHISHIYDTTPSKQGRLTPLSHIPIVDASTFGTDRPDVAVLFAWNHADEIQSAEAAFGESGGRWLTYVPDVRIT